MTSLQQFDHDVMYGLSQLQRPWLNDFMEFMSVVGDTVVMPILAVVACLAFVAFRQYRAAAILAVAALTGLLLSEAVKNVVDRQRPDVDWRLIERPHSASFPSGHSLNSMCILGAAALLTARRLPRRWVGALLVLLGMGVSLLIGVSRSYLGVHWPSDVLSGWCAGLACALLAWWIDGCWPLPKSAHPRPESVDASRP
jgi:undecaprenyl-diphosphatase